MLDQRVSRRGFVRIGAIAGAALLSGGLLSACSADGQGSSSQNDDSQQGQQAPAAEQQPQSKVLVAYYSAQGHTRTVAETIADELDADLFEIVPEQPYSSDDLNWDNENSRVSREHEDESLRDVPLAKVAPDNFAGYETVILGYPIWWAIAAWPTDHFVTDNDFSGKKVVTFCTSASSGLGQSTTLLANAAGSGDWQDGQRFASNADENDVRTWAQSLGL